VASSLKKVEEAKYKSEEKKAVSFADLKAIKRQKDQDERKGYGSVKEEMVEDEDLPLEKK
jgi:hypothetical protein